MGRRPRCGLNALLYKPRPGLGRLLNAGDLRVRVRLTGPTGPWGVGTGGVGPVAHLALFQSVPPKFPPPPPPRGRGARPGDTCRAASNGWTDGSSHRERAKCGAAADAAWLTEERTHDSWCSCLVR